MAYSCASYYVGYLCIQQTDHAYEAGAINFISSVQIKKNLMLIEFN